MPMFRNTSEVQALVQRLESGWAQLYEISYWDYNERKWRAHAASWETWYTVHISGVWKQQHTSLGCNGEEWQYPGPLKEVVAPTACVFPVCGVQVTLHAWHG